MARIATVRTTGGAASALLPLAIAGRRLTRTEWNDVLPERDYAPAC